jgi:hypothetical protein
MKTGWMALCGALALLTLPVGAVANPKGSGADETPDAFVRRVYARYHSSGPGVSTERPAGTPYYSAQLLDAFAKDVELAKGEVGAIDGDPICSCQDYGNLRVKSVTISEAGPDAAKARVAFTNLGSQTVVTLSLIRTPAGWRIADVEDKESGSVLALLRAEIAHAAQPSASGAPGSPANR